jgi:MoxR-like ATPase
MYELSAPFVGREEEARVILLTLLSREHGIFLGEPGTAKSALVRRAAELLNAKFFKYLLTRFTEPAELFGPLDIKALEKGVYVRLSSGKLPDAEIAFLDEIFKANSAILNALNTLLQERVLYDGYTELTVPLWSLFGASNEVPEEPEIEAFYDRFVIRHFVRSISEDRWKELLNSSWEIEKKLYFEGGLGGEKLLAMNDLRKFHELLFSVNLDPIKNKLVKLFAVFESRGVHVTDRRKGKALKVIAANALIEGRSYAEEEDLIVLKYVIPRDWDELEKVNTVLSEELKTPYKYIRELQEIKTNVKEVMNYVISLQGIDSRFVEMRFRQIYRDLEITRDRVMGVMLESSDREVEKLANEVIEVIDVTLEMIRKRMHR